MNNRLRRNGKADSVEAGGWDLVCAAVVEWVVYFVPVGTGWGPADAGGVWELGHQRLCRSDVQKACAFPVRS